VFEKPSLFVHSLAVRGDSASNAFVGSESRIGKPPALSRVLAGGSGQRGSGVGQVQCWIHYCVDAVYEIAHSQDVGTRQGVRE
jgi:hypothetical protein